MDFTIKQYQKLLESLQNAGFFFQRYSDYAKGESNLQYPVQEQLTQNKFQDQTSNTEQRTLNNERGTPNKLVVLRHDVDARPQNSLKFAQIQSKRGIKGTYYFRVVPQSFDEEIINEIASLGHEIGYHYETMDTCRGNVDRAYDEFCRNLEKFRKITTICTISMHGSPLSKFDNRNLWKKYDYKKLGILAEPYFDMDFNKIFYITDTGRRWDGHRFNVRDKATKDNPVTNPEFINLSFHSTHDIIGAVKRGAFPNRVMLNFHPQRWNAGIFPWMKEIIFQNVKNQGKRIIIVLRR